MPKINKVFHLEITPQQFLQNCSSNELEEMGLLLDTEIKRRSKILSCRVCGCSDYDCAQCIEKTGEPCHWVEPDLCSACVAVETFKQLTE